MESKQPDKRIATPPHVLTIAGSDSGGGAGIQADLKTFEAWKCYGSSVLTGLTAQNTTGVKAVHQVPTDFVMQQLKAVWDDGPPQAIKLGMLTSASTVDALATYFARLPNASSSKPIIVLDPVMISTSGHMLIGDEAMASIRNNLIQHVDWLTPNIPEAMALTDMADEGDMNVESLFDMMDVGHELSVKYNAPYLLLKGGHKPWTRRDVKSLASAAMKAGVELVWLDDGEEGDCVEVLQRQSGEDADDNSYMSEKMVVDMLQERDSDRTTWFISKYIRSSSTHGTGCTLSSALACSIALAAESGADISAQAICQRAIEYVKSSIASAYSFGQGHGPLNHAHMSYRRALPPPTPSNPHPFVSHLIRSDLPLWKSYVRHPFVIQLGNGTLPRESFEHYIKQDYIYLQHYARAHALGAYKSTTFESISYFTSIAAHIARESSMHVAYCESFGISLATLEQTTESAPCAAYARYILDVGAQGDILDLYVAVASCLIGYGEVGLWLQKEVKAGRGNKEGNLYAKWMEDYSGKEYLDAVDRGIENLEKLIAADPPSPARLERLTKIWQECVRLERDFWEMGLKLL